MSRAYHFGRARRAIRAEQMVAGNEAASAALDAVQKKDLASARLLYAAAALHFKAAGLYDNQVQCEKARAYLDGYSARMAS